MGVDGEPLQKPKIDEAFVLPPDLRPTRPHNSYTPTDRIPVIDLSPLHHFPRDESSMKTLADEIGRACKQWGFFQVINHGVPLDILEKVKEEAKAFFALPVEEKREVRRTFENALGYFDTELTKNVRDWKQIFDFMVNGTLQLPLEYEGDNKETQVFYNQWPANPRGFREACETYALAAQQLGFSLLELMAQSLGLPADRFHRFFMPSNTSMTLMRLNYYPVCPVPDLVLGVSRHKDSGALSVLAQDDVGGLEVRRKDGEWIAVPPDPSSFVINVGDVMQVWSNDKYESIEHRVVVNENKDRYSFPVLLNPSYWVNVSPIPELISEEYPPRYRPIDWGKFSKRKKDTNYKNFGVENLQISHYAINRKW